MATILILLGAAWVVCGIFAYGLTFAYFQRSFPGIAKRYYDDDRRFAVLAGLMGPIGLVAVLITAGLAGGLKGFKFR